MQASLHQLLVAVHAHARRGGPAPTRHAPLLAAMLLLYMEPQAPPHTGQGLGLGLMEPLALPPPAFV